MCNYVKGDRVTAVSVLYSLLTLCGVCLLTWTCVCPDIAELILNKCTEPEWSSEGEPTAQKHPDKYTVSFNFELLEGQEKGIFPLKIRYCMGLH